MSSKKTKYGKWIAASGDGLRRMTLAADFNVAAAADDTSPPTFSLVAYTGAPIRQSWSRNALVMDLGGMDLSNQSIPILFGHDASLESVVGQATSVKSDGSQLLVEGVVLGVSETASRVLELARRGMKFQASIGADVGRIENIQAGESVQVNGRTFAGPVSIVRGSALRETSIVLMGADASTSAAIAAEAIEDVAMADHATEPTNKVEAGADGAAGKPITDSLPIAAKGHDGDALMERAKKLEEAVKAEREQREALAQRLELAEKRLSRGPAIHTGEPAVDGDKVVEAALCMNAGLPKVEQHYDERTLEAANKARKNVSLQETLLRAAKANGYDGSANVKANIVPILQAAFATHQISQLLEAAVNKFLLAGFTAVEQSWQTISAIRSVNDFKAINMYRLNGSFKFVKVGNAGELKVAAGNDYKRSVAAETYGITTQLTRQDIVNDDLNALSLIPQRIGRGAALSLNEVLWGVFQDSNDTYFQKVNPAAGNALSYSSLEAAVTAYRRLNDPDGNPLGIAPRQLLVPPELEPKAAQLMTQSALVVSSLGSTSSKAVEPSANVFAGRYRIVTSNYLTSSSTWWLMADAADLPALDVVFLNGQQVPTIEQVQADYQLLGVQMRGYMDFGVIKGEPLSCLRMATA